MPELAEVETVRRQIEKHLVGLKIKDVEVDEKDRFLFAHAPAKDVREALLGRKIRSVGRKGKYFWMSLDRAPALLCHLGMTGNVGILDPKIKGEGYQKLWGGVKLWSEREEDVKSRLWFCRLLLTFEKGFELALLDPRRFGRVWLADDPVQHPKIQALGYDPLFEFPSVKELGAMFAKRTIPIKTLLLDQALFAGIGNWLADEILYQSRLSPHRRGQDLKPAELTVLRRQILAVVKKAVAVEADYERFPKQWLFNDRWGKKKGAQTHAGQVIKFDEIGGRTSAWVPKHQR